MQGNIQVKSFHWLTHDDIHKPLDHALQFKRTRNF